jgi:glycine/D-amino acid oxidase-like deaminating enzyme
MTLESQRADVVICGAGIAGVAVAYTLALHRGINDILLVDERAPLTLTSDKSSEGYRNWWPGPGQAMVQLMNRSIDLLETLARESENRFHMNRRGYVYLTADPARVSALQRDAAEISGLGSGPLRVDKPYTPAAAQGYRDPRTGADLVLDPAIIQAMFPFVTADALAMLHARRCGWLSAQQLGMVLLGKARQAGVRLLNGRVTGVTISSNHVDSVLVQTGNDSIRIVTRTFVNAAGPLVKQVGTFLGVDLPVFNELHGKIAFEDSFNIIPRDAPLMIWNDPISLTWSADERQELTMFDDTAWLLDEFPAGLHFRPEGGADSQTLLLLWPYHRKTLEHPLWPVQFEPEFVEIVLRGLTRMVPGMAVYLERMNPPYVDGGYYCKTPENRPLICPLPLSGAYLFGALSGYGIMAALAGAELLSDYISGSDLPSYAPAFHLSRYDDTAYQALLRDWDATAGQL